MVEAKQISRFFLALVSAGGEMTRTHLAGKIWQRNWTSKQLDELLASPLLAGLVVTSREHVRGTGRHPVRYVLTGEGWAIARTWQLPMPSNTIAPEETRRQFQMLVQGGNLWARDLDRDARAWRAHMEQERQKRDARIAAEKERAKEFAKENKPPRKRSEKDLAQRRAFVASKNAEKEQLDRGGKPRPNLWRGVAEPGSPFGVPTPARPTFQTVAPRSPQTISEPDGWLDAESLRIIRAATERMYRVRREDNRILYNNTQWLTPKEWWAKMHTVFE